jgi:hypothetical protein
MLNVIQSVNWDVYKVPNPELDIAPALENLNSDEEAKRMGSLWILDNMIDYSMEEHNELIFDLIRVLFKLLQLDVFKYKDYAGEILALCGAYTKSRVTSLENIIQQNRLRELLCEQLALNSSITEEALGKQNKEYLMSACREE